MSIPLQNILPPPPEYRKTAPRDGPESVHNHYHIGHDEHNPGPWYRRKWVFWTLIGVLVFFVVAGLIIMGVVLKVELGKKAAADGGRPSPPSSTTKSGATATTGDDDDDDAPTQATATPFAMLDKSQLASAFARAPTDASPPRRLLIKQEDTNHLLVTEWADDGRQITHYRLADRLADPLTSPEAKPGTPLALQADDAGTLHLFYLSRSNVLSYVYETTAGTWKTGDVSDEHGSIRTSAYSGLSAAWHNGKRATGLLVVAFDNPSQKLQLAMSDTPRERGSWSLADVTSVAGRSVPGQSNVPCYSLAGDWWDLDDGSGSAATGRQKNKSGNQHLLLAVADASEVHAWQCAVDFWPPPDAQVRCRQVDEHFRDGRGTNLTLVPPPTQFAWIKLQDGRDTSTSNHDFVLLSRDGGGVVRENAVGAGISRKPGAGFTARTDVRALAATSEGVVFASSGKDVFVYSRSGGGRWRPVADTNATFQV